MSNRLWIVDMDDTCGAISYAYKSAIAGAYQLVVGQMRERAPDIGPFFRAAIEIDKSLVSRRGQTRGGFAETLAETYLYLCSEFGVTPDSAIEARCYELGAAVYFADFPLLPGALELPPLLEAKGDRVVLVTNGDEFTQQMKLESTGMDKVFREVICTPTGKGPTLSRLAREQGNPQNVYSIGDNPASDGVPLTGLGRFLMVDRGAFADNRVDGLSLPPTRLVRDLAHVAASYDLLVDPDTWSPEKHLTPV